VLLPHELLCVRCWRHVAKPRLPPLPVVEEVDVFGDFTRGFGARLVAAMMLSPSAIK